VSLPPIVVMTEGELFVARRSEEGEYFGVVTRPPASSFANRNSVVRTVLFDELLESNLADFTILDVLESSVGRPTGRGELPRVPDVRDEGRASVIFYAISGFHSCHYRVQPRSDGSDKTSESYEKPSNETPHDHTSSAS
jgi:hypothetical protein